MAPRPKPSVPSWPTESDLATRLGASGRLWKRLRVDLAALGVDVEEWKCYSKKAGWSLRLKKRDRAIVYLLPADGGFCASFVLGPRAMGAVQRADWPSGVRALIAKAPRYVEGTAVRIEVRTDRDVEVAEALARIKLEH